MAEESGMLTVAAVAKELKTTPLNVLMHIKRGLLNGMEVDGVWYVSAESLNKYLSQANEAAHGNLCQSKSHCQHGCSSCG